MGLAIYFVMTATKKKTGSGHPDRPAPTGIHKLHEMHGSQIYVGQGGHYPTDSAPIRESGEPPFPNKHQK